MWEDILFTREDISIFGGDSFLESFLDDIALDDLDESSLSLLYDALDDDINDRTQPTVADAFAREYITKLSLPPEAPPKPCCTQCASILDATFDKHLSNIGAAAESCDICRLLHCTALQYTNNERDVRITRHESWLRLGRGGPRILRLVSPSSTDNHPACTTSQAVQIGSPVLFKTGDSNYFALLREWLKSCDNDHTECHKRNDHSRTKLPTRLVYVGDINSQRLLLYHPTGNESFKYVALSYCWGDTDDSREPEFRTIHDNIEARKNVFYLSDLPKTHQDAVRVTRELGIEYLWIDSLCIIQFDDEEWKRESKRMEDVYSLAYCVLAATSATDKYDGFLERKAEPEYIHARDGLGQPFYICTDVDDFDQHVEESPLNKRAWVLQERVLARRTFHFAASQTYWECGERIYCENLTTLRQLEGRKKYFMSDPYFPDRLLKTGPRSSWGFIRALLEDYTKRDLADKRDRRFAISGLEERIASTLRCESRYGIFQQYFHRNLLWQPSSDKIERIAYNYHVPSWSWMAYNGGIQFMEIPFNEVDWIIDNHLRFDKERDHAIVASLGELKNCTMEGYGKEYVVFCPQRKKRGWTQYDVEDSKGLCMRHCVVVGRKRKGGIDNYYILVVKPTSGDGKYRRIGVGQIQSDYVVRLPGNIRLV